MFLVIHDAAMGKELRVELIEPDGNTAWADLGHGDDGFSCPGGSG